MEAPDVPGPRIGRPVIKSGVSLCASSPVLLTACEAAEFHAASLRKLRSLYGPSSPYDSRRQPGSQAEAAGRMFSATSNTLPNPTL
jgi:hypothetical protein